VIGAKNALEVGDVLFICGDGLILIAAHPGIFRRAPGLIQFLGFLVNDARILDLAHIPGRIRTRGIARFVACVAGSANLGCDRRGA